MVLYQVVEGALSIAKEKEEEKKIHQDPTLINFTAVDSGQVDMACTHLPPHFDSATRFPNSVLDILTPTLYWPMIEASLGVVGASLPTMRPIAKRCLPAISLQKLRSRTTSTWALFSRRPSSSLDFKPSGGNPESEKLPSVHPSQAGKPDLHDHTVPVTAMDDGCCDNRW